MCLITACIYSSRANVLHVPIVYRSLHMPIVLLASPESPRMRAYLNSRIWQGMPGYSSRKQSIPCQCGILCL